MTTAEPPQKKPDISLDNQALFQRIALALHGIVPGRKWFVVVGGDGPDQGMLSASNTDRPDQVGMLTDLLDSFEKERATQFETLKVEVKS